MKKQGLALLMALVLTLVPVMGLGAQQTQYTLKEKMQKQLDAGSGLQGTITLSGLPALKDLTLDVRYIAPEIQSQVQLALSSGGAELAKLLMYQQGDVLAADAGLSSGKIYSFSGGWETLLSYLSTGDLKKTQSPLPALLLDILSPKDAQGNADLETAASPYLTKVDLWMQAFAAQPAVEKNSAGLSLTKVEYSIPAASLKAELKQLLMDLLKDDTLLPLLWARMSQQQANLYLNPSLQSFYFQAVDALPLTGDIHLLRRVTTLGQVTETSVTLPMAGELKQVSLTQTATQTGDAFSLEALSEQGTLAFSLAPMDSGTQDSLILSGLVRWLPAQNPGWQVGSTEPQYSGKALSLTYQATLTQTTATGAEGKANETYDLSLYLNPDWSHLAGEATDEVKAQYALTMPAKFTLSLLLKSGQARNSSTALTADAVWSYGDTNVKLNAQFKTMPPWTFQQVDMASAIPVESLTQQDLTALGLELLSKPGLLQTLPFLVQDDSDSLG